MGRKPKSQNSQPEGEAMETIQLQLSLGDSVETVEQSPEELTNEVISDILNLITPMGVTRLEAGSVPAIVPGPVTEADLRAAKDPDITISSGLAEVYQSSYPSQGEKILNTLLDFSKSDGEVLARIETQLKQLNSTSAANQQQVATLTSETEALKNGLVGFNSLVESVSSLKQVIVDLQSTQALQQEALLAALSSLNVVKVTNVQQDSKVSENAPQESTEANNQGQLPWEDPKPTTEEAKTEVLLLHAIPEVCRKSIIDFLPQLHEACKKGALKMSTGELAAHLAKQLGPDTDKDTPEELEFKAKQFRPQIAAAIVQLFAKMGWGTVDKVPNVTDNYTQVKAS